MWDQPNRRYTIRLIPKILDLLRILDKFFKMGLFHDWTNWSSLLEVLIFQCRVTFFLYVCIFLWSGMALPRKICRCLPRYGSRYRSLQFNLYSLGSAVFRLFPANLCSFDHDLKHNIRVWPFSIDCWQKTGCQSRILKMIRKKNFLYDRLVTIVFFANHF